MPEYGIKKSVALVSAASSPGLSAEAVVSGYTVGLLDLSISSVAAVSFMARGVTNQSTILGTFLDGTTSSSSYTTSVGATKLIRFNVSGCETFQMNVTTVSIGTISATLTVVAAGTAVTT